MRPSPLGLLQAPGAPWVIPAGRSSLQPPAAAPAMAKKACVGCSGGAGAEPPRGDGGSGGIALEPFPRQVLVGDSGGPTVYCSAIFDATHWRRIAWWFELYAAVVGTPLPPATAYLDTSGAMDGPWTEMIPGGEPGVIGTPATGTVQNPKRFVRAAISVRAGETAAVALRMVARQG